MQMTVSLFPPSGGESESALDWLPRKRRLFLPFSSFFSTPGGAFSMPKELFFFWQDNPLIAPEREGCHTSSGQKVSLFPREEAESELANSLLLDHFFLSREDTIRRQ